MGNIESKVDSMGPDIKYDGEVNIKGQRHGQGTLTYPSGSMYIGYWVENKKHGVGRFVSACGNVYEGEWKDDERSGQGKLLSSDGAIIYEGTWMSDKMHGEEAALLKIA